MPDGFDINVPSLDRGHEAIRLAVVQAIADSGDSFDLVDVLFELLDGAMTQVNDLETRIAALETPSP